MVWDLGLAMRKKEEFESERLMNFEFWQRVRATRLLNSEAIIANVLATATQGYEAEIENISINLASGQ